MSVEKWRRMQYPKVALLRSRYILTHACEKRKLCSRQVECAKTRFKSKTAKPGFGHFWKNTILPILS